MLMKSSKINLWEVFLEHNTYVYSGRVVDRMYRLAYLITVSLIFGIIRDKKAAWERFNGLFAFVKAVEKSKNDSIVSLLDDLLEEWFFDCCRCYSRLLKEQQNISSVEFADCLRKYNIENNLYGSLIPLLDIVYTTIYVDGKLYYTSDDIPGVLFMEDVNNITTTWNYLHGKQLFSDVSSYQYNKEEKIMYVQTDAQNEPIKMHIDTGEGLAD